jgi:hypothetical protein
MHKLLRHLSSFQAMVIMLFALTLFSVGTLNAMVID